MWLMVVFVRSSIVQFVGFHIKRVTVFLFNIMILTSLLGCAQTTPNPLSASARQQLRFSAFQVSVDLGGSMYLGDEPKVFEGKVRKALEQRFASLYTPGAADGALLRFKVVHYWMPPAGLALVAGSIKESADAAATIERGGQAIATYNVRLDTGVGNLGAVIGALSNIDQGEDLAKQLVEVGYNQIMGK
jgi:hypothetical protein